MSDFTDRVFDIINEKDPDLMAEVIAQIEKEDQGQDEQIEEEKDLIL